MTVPTVRLGFVTFWQVIMKTNEPLVEETEALRRLISDERAAWRSAGKKLTQLKSSVSAYEEPAARLVEPKNRYRFPMWRRRR